MSFKNCRVVGIDVDPREYHSVSVDRGSRSYPVSPSMLKEFIHCPQRWVSGYRSPDSDAKAHGSLVDAALLTPNRFATDFIVEPDTYPASADNKEKGVKKGDPIPWSNNAKFCRAWRAEAEGHGATVISSDELVIAQKAVKRFEADQILSQYLEESDRQVLVQGEWECEENGITVPVRCLIDLAPFKDSEFAETLADLKAVRNASVQPFTRQVYQYGWHIQAAFDLALYNAATGEGRHSWCFLVQESYPPFECGRRILSHDFEHIGQGAYKSAMAVYCECLKTGKWPGYDDHDEATQGWSIVEAEPWMGSESMFSRRPVFEVEGENESDPNDIVP